MTTRPDVVVVGARAAGAALALLLARAGMSVVVLDRARPGTDTLSTHALMRGAVVQLQRWGLLDQIVAAGAPPVTRTTFHYATGDVEIDLKPSAGVEALYAPRRTLLDPTLVAAALRAGAEVRFGTSVSRLVWRHDRVVGVETSSHREGTAELRAPLVVGADGRHSTVAGLVSAPVTERGGHTSAFVYAYVHGLDAVGYEWGYGPGATAGFIPTNGGLTCVFGGARPGRIGRGGYPVLLEVVGEASPGMGERLRRAAPASPAHTFTGQPGHLLRPWGPGWALVGDAGSWKDPISAHGLTDALRDAELLARAILGAATCAEPDAGGFRHYEQVRDDLTLPILRLSDEIAAMAWDDARIVDLLRGLKIAMNAELEVILGFDAIPAEAAVVSPV